MIELFTDISPFIKQQLERVINLAIDSMELKECAELIADFAKTRPDREQDFIDFYFNLRMEQMKNENNSN